MRDQLVAGLVLGATAVVAAIAGLGWLTLAAALASVPFLVAGVGLAVGGLRATRDEPAGTIR